MSKRNISLFAIFALAMPVLLTGCDSEAKANEDVAKRRDAQIEAMGGHGTTPTGPAAPK